MAVIPPSMGIGINTSLALTTYCVPLRLHRQSDIGRGLGGGNVLEHKARLFKISLPRMAERSLQMFGLESIRAYSLAQNAQIF